MSQSHVNRHPSPLKLVCSVVTWQVNAHQIIEALDVHHARLNAGSSAQMVQGRLEKRLVHDNALSRSDPFRRHLDLKYSS